MPTTAQILANRRNARRSTGPRSPEGKALVARNPIKHGLLARQDVISSESWRLRRTSRIHNETIDALLAKDTESPLAKLTRSLFPKTSQPAEPAETAQSADLPPGRMAAKDFAHTRVLDRLLMYERRMENSLHKNIVELERLRLIKQLTPASNTLSNQCPM